MVIISHTEHYFRDGVIVGWGSTVEEINHLSARWDEVVHIACLYGTDAPLSSRSYLNSNIRFVPLKPTGGARLTDKLGVVVNAPDTIRTVAREIRDATSVQLRTPTGIGVYLLPAFSFLFKRNFKFWVKYAGNWNAPTPASGYRFQRWWLSKNWANCAVTINGSWSAQPEHCISFENPCLTTSDLEIGREFSARKEFSPPYRLIFVGRLEDEKGVNVMLDSLAQLSSDQIERVDIVGDGPKREEYESRCKNIGIGVIFHGFCDRPKVHSLASDAHFMLLPSQSEGFPKVIAEAACYGCLPVVSRVGSIDQYINETNGFLWEPSSSQPFAETLRTALYTEEPVLKQKAHNLTRLAEKFSFDRYIVRLEKEILCS